MVSSENQSALRQWLCERIGLTPTENIQCLGSVIGGRIRGVVGFDSYNGASVQMHSAGEPGWITKDMLWATFDYPFNVCGLKMVIGLVPSGNEVALRFNTHLGFKTELSLDDAHPDGALVLMTMRRGECRFLRKRS